MDDGLGLSATGSSPSSAEKGKAPMEVQQRAETLKHKCIKVRIFWSPASLNSADVALRYSPSVGPCTHHKLSLKRSSALSDTWQYQFQDRARQCLLQGYKAQSEMVLESLDKLIRTCEARSESMVVEGVHLSLNAVMRLMQKHPSIVPFLVHISNEAKHRERFAVHSLGLLLAPERHAHECGQQPNFPICIDWWCISMGRRVAWMLRTASEQHSMSQAQQGSLHDLMAACAQRHNALMRGDLKYSQWRPQQQKQGVLRACANGCQVHTSSAKYKYRHQINQTLVQPVCPCMYSRSHG